MPPEVPVTQVFITNLPDPITGLETYITNFPTPIPLNSAIETVLPIVCALMVMLFAVYPVIMVLRKLILFGAELSHSKTLLQLESGGFWSRAFRSLDTPHLENQANNSSRFQIFRKRGTKN